MAEYKVNLDIYHGPMDLLLYLIKREEVDIHSVPITKITRQYIAHVDPLRELDPNLSGEFLVLAATLMEIKTRMLLPSVDLMGEEGQEDSFDPRVDLIRQLLHYKQFKDAAEELQTLAKDQALTFQRKPGDFGTDDQEFDMDDVQPWDLFETFSSIMEEIGRRPGKTEIIYDDTPQERHQDRIIERLREEGTFLFRSLFDGGVTRSEICGIFLAVLELIREKLIRATKGDSALEIRIELHPDPPEPEKVE